MGVEFIGDDGPFAFAQGRLTDDRKREMTPNSELRTPNSPPVLIKIGGALVGDAKALAPLWDGLSALRAQAPVVLVHGGGPQATALARQLGHEPRIVKGRRVTSDLDLDIVLWTLRGALNARLVAAAQAAGLPAVGISGVDGGLLRVQKRPPWNVDGEEVDFGWVGDVQEVQPGVLHALLGQGFVPVVAPLGIDEAGNLYNVNADTVACAIAAAIGAETFLLVTESGGVRRDASDPVSRLASVDTATFAAGQQAGWISGGMLPKLTVAFDALQRGIPNVHILSPDDIVTRTHGTTVTI